MWGLFLATAIVAISLFGPGFLVLRGFGVSRCLAFSLAPLLGVAAYVLVGLAYEKLGVWSCWASQAGLLYIVAAMSLQSCVSRLSGNLLSHFPFRTMEQYLAVGYRSIAYAFLATVCVRVCGRFVCLVFRVLLFVCAAIRQY